MHFVSESCAGERCRCGDPATHKIGEEIPRDDPDPIRHNLTAYVCCYCFIRAVGPAAAVTCQWAYGTIGKHIVCPPGFRLPLMFPFFRSPSEATDDPFGIPAIRFRLINERSEAWGRLGSYDMHLNQPQDGVVADGFYDLDPSLDVLLRRDDVARYNDWISSWLSHDVADRIEKDAG